LFIVINQVVADSDILKALREEGAVIERQMNVLQERLKALNAAIRSLEPLYEKSAEPAVLNGPFGLFSPGITEAIRTVYGADSYVYLSPTQVRDKLRRDGLLKGYDNEMAVIHQVIRRLEEQGKIEAHPTEKTHRWVNRGALGIRKTRVGPRPLSGPDDVKK
jgi:hypothetical protein